MALLLGRHVPSEDLRKEITVLFDKCPLASLGSAWCSAWFPFQRNWRHGTHEAHITKAKKEIDDLGRVF